MGLIKFNILIFGCLQDFGGSGVIHVIGGAAALTLSVVLGPRYGRIRDRKSKIIFNDLDGHSLPVSLDNTLPIYGSSD